METEDLFKPRLPIAKVAQYVHADPIRRKKIVSEATDPQPFKRDRYGVPARAITDEILGDDHAISRALDALITKVARNEQHAARISSSIECLEAFSSSKTEMGGQDAQPFKLLSASRMFEIEGLEIIAAPNCG